ncbi:MAG: dethiobiotin synthase, partial [Coxiellaceae bacterium]|nr:dethiobiotin synthase [Coxiellaceae bacterium]
MLENGSYFIAGTDTEVGKTYCCCALLRQMNEHGKSTIGLKPVASGCELIDNQLVNDDALQLQRAASITLDIKTINPFSFAAPISPHLAAAEDGVTLTAQDVKQALQPGLQAGADITLVEGTGGWYAPINKHETMADIAIALGYPVILVVGMKLGCLNHALLTAQAIQRSGLPLCGWIANDIDPDMLQLQANIDTLQQKWGQVLTCRTISRTASQDLTP